MKVRTSFVTNSSSSSFIIMPDSKKDNEEIIEEIINKITKRYLIKEKAMKEYDKMTQMFCDLFKNPKHMSYYKYSVLKHTSQQAVELLREFSTSNNVDGICHIIDCSKKGAKRKINSAFKNYSTFNKMPFHIGRKPSHKKGENVWLYDSRLKIYNSDLRMKQNLEKALSEKGIVIVSDKNTINIDDRESIIRQYHATFVYLG